MKKGVAAFILTATAILAAGLAANERWLLALAGLGGGLLWLAGVSQGWRWSDSAGLILLVGMAASAIGVGVPVWWMLPAVILALAAWDLSNFSQRLESTIDDSSGLKKTHLKRLGLVTGLGAGLGVVALGIQISLNVGWAMALGLLASLSLSWVVRRLKRGEEQP